MRLWYDAEIADEFADLAEVFGRERNIGGRERRAGFEAEEAAGGGEEALAHAGLEQVEAPGAGVTEDERCANPLGAVVTDEAGATGSRTMGSLRQRLAADTVEFGRGRCPAVAGPLAARTQAPSIAFSARRCRF